MMSYSHSDPPCSSLTRASTAQRMYQALIISVPVSFASIVLIFFYLCYLRRQRAYWSSIRMRASYADTNNGISRSELGMKKELREMLPIIVYRESFSIRDTQCSVCLADYQAEDRLQQIPACGHTFHMDCIDHWLTTHTTCPLCRLSLLATKSSTELPHDVHDASIQLGPHAWEETQAIQISESSLGDVRLPQNNSKDARNSNSFDHEREFTGSRYDTERHELNDGFSALPISRTEPV